MRFSKRTVLALGVVALLVGLLRPHPRARRRLRAKRSRKHRHRPAAEMVRPAHGHESSHSPYKDLKWRFIGPDIIGGRCTDVAVPRAAGRSLRRLGHGRRVEDRQRRHDLGAPHRRPPDAFHRRPRRLRVQSQHRLDRHRARPTSSGPPSPGSGVYKSTDAGKTWTHMGLDGTHTIGRVLIHPDEPGHRLCRGHRPRMDQQPRPRRLQDDRRRQDLAKGPLRQREGRGQRPGHGPATIPTPSSPPPGTASGGAGATPSRAARTACSRRPTAARPGRPSTPACPTPTSPAASASTSA